MIAPSFTSAVQLLAGSVKLELYGRRIYGRRKRYTRVVCGDQREVVNKCFRGAPGAANAGSVRKSWLKSELGSVDLKLSL